MSTHASAYRRVLQGDPCSYCGEPVAHIDHIQAGGGNDWSNLTGACERCNARKSDVPLLFALLGTSPTRPRRKPKPPREVTSPEDAHDRSLGSLRTWMRSYEAALAALSTYIPCRDALIQDAHEHGVSIEEIAAEIGVSFQLIGRIVGRRTQTPKRPIGEVGSPTGPTKPDKEVLP